jgi:methionyl-tRNA synthetase
MKSTKPKILLTSALPYANGSIHVGHLVEYIQTDIYSRFLKLIGEDVIYCCADDAHGTAIEIKADQQKTTPEKLISKVKAEHIDDFKKFHISFDNYYSTHSEENKILSTTIYEKLKEKGFIYTKDIESFYDENAKRFLPDRYVKGECPKCNAPDQYGDVCEKCNSTYKPIDLINPYSTLTKTTPIRMKTLHYFFKLSAMSEQLKSYFNERNFQPEVMNYLNNWIEEGLQDWDISRDGPYFGFNIPGEENKYFYVWLDAPIGYLASCKNYCDKNKLDAGKEYFFNPDSKMIHIIGKDIMYFHFLFWPAMLMAAGFHVPDDIIVHGFLTVNREKMSKSRGTFVMASQFADMYNPEYLRYYYAKVLSKKMNDIDLDFDAFIESVNSELVANLGNFCYRALSFINKHFEGKISDFNDLDYPIITDIINKVDNIKKNYSSLNLNQTMLGIMEISSLGNKFFQDNAPWKLVKEGDLTKAQQICSVCSNIAKILSVIISPVLPVFSDKLQKQLKVKNQSWDDINFSLKNHHISLHQILISKIEEKVELNSPGKENREIKFHIDKEIKSLGLKVCVAQISGIHVKKKHEGLEKIKKNLVENFKLLDNHKEILEEYHKIYTKVNADTKTSIEYLHNLIEHKGQLPQINTVVDSYNVVSAKTMLAMGAYDLNKISGDIHLRYVDSTDKYSDLDTSEIKSVPSNEFAYVDDKGNILCRLNIKQSAQTKVDKNTSNVVLIVDGNNLVDDNLLLSATEEACKNIVKYCGGNYKIVGLDDDFPLDLRVAEVKHAKLHPNSEKLLIMSIDLGEDNPRQLVAGIQKYYTPEKLIGKKIIVVSNLKPAKLGGELSQGMLIAADCEDIDVVKIIEAPNGSPGEQVKCGAMSSNRKEIKITDFFKLKIVTKNEEILVTNFDKKLTLKGEPLKIHVPDGSKIG